MFQILDLNIRNKIQRTIIIFHLNFIIQIHLLYRLSITSRSTDVENCGMCRGFVTQGYKEHP